MLKEQINNFKTLNNMKHFVGILLFIIAIGIMVMYGINNIHLTQDCTGHLKRAADANTVELAKTELGTAIKYLEDNNLTRGYTSIIYKTPNEDIGFFYNNLIDSYNELNKVNDSTSSLEKSNILMKLRETLIDNGEKGDNLTYPQGLSRYPNNFLWGLCLGISIIVLLGLIVWVMAINDL